MKRRNAMFVLAGAISLLGVGIGLWFITMPYPIEVWWKAHFNLRYSDQWPISESDFDTAIHLVKPYLGWREIVTSVSVTGPDEVKIGTTCRLRPPLAGGGQRFTIRKVSGEWMIAKQGFWLS